MRRLFWLLAFLLLSAAPARADLTICGSAPYQLLNGTTADATQVMGNFNALISCVNTNAAAVGANTTINSLSGLLSPPSAAGSLYYAGATVAGTANAITVPTTYPVTPYITTGSCVQFTPASTNTGPTTLTVGGGTTYNVNKSSTVGLVALNGGEIAAGVPVRACYNGTVYVLDSVANLVEDPPSYGVIATSVSGTTTLSAAACPTLHCTLTGYNNISSFGSTATAGQIYYVKVSGQFSLIYNATSMILPGATNRTTNFGDTFAALYLGSSNWQVLYYNAATPAAIGSISPLARGLTIQVTSSTAISVTADYAVLGDNDSSVSTYCPSFSATINTGTAGPGGLDTGSLASTWYYVYIISNGTTCSAVMSASSAAPTLSSGYSSNPLYMRVGAVSLDGSLNLYRTIQKGTRAQYQVTGATNTPNLPIIVASSIGSPTTPTWQAIAMNSVSLVPPTAQAVNLGILNANSGTIIMVAPNNAYGAWNSVANPPPCVDNYVTSGGLFAYTCSMVLESSNIYAASTAGSTGVVFLSGWVDAVAAH